MRQNVLSYLILYSARRFITEDLISLSTYNPVCGMFSVIGSRVLSPYAKYPKTPMIT